LELTYPAGRGPRVFTAGWIFGARCLTNAGMPDEQDCSNRVRWSGSGIFSPAMGAVSRPTFEREGTNTIVLTVQAGNREISKEYTVEAVSPRGYARLGDRSLCNADSHGCPACPHVTIGPITSGSPTVMIGGLPAARVGDGGVAAACCGPNTFVIAAGDSTVLIDGRPAARFGDRTQHCGGVGRIADGASRSIPAWEAEYARASKGESDWVAIPIRKGEIPQPVQPAVQPKPADTGSTDAAAQQRQAILEEYRRLYPGYLTAFYKTSEWVEVIANAAEIGPDKYRCAYIAWGRIKDGPRKGEPAKDAALDLTFTLQQLQGQIAGMKKLLGQ
jgi:uncharacterized Zn-binding protein involved in type VI secretion